MRKVLAVLMVLGAAIYAAPWASAACGPSTPIFHSGTFFQCADALNGTPVPVTAYAWQIASTDSGVNTPATVNSGTVKIECESFGDNAGTCLFSPNDPGDGIVTIESDWANPGWVGCPVSATGPHRVAIAVQDAVGNGLIVSVSGATSEFGYQVDMAHPFDAGTFAELPLACADANGKPHIVSVSSSSISLTFKKPFIYSDCDPNSLGVQAFALGFTATPACSDSFSGSTAASITSIYTSNQLCGTKPNVDKSVWTKNAVTPDASGNATISFTAPPTGQCLFVGSSVNVLGVEGNSITGFVEVAGPGAASPKALDVRAAKAGGNVTVTWHTDSELGLASFSVLTSTSGKGSLSLSTQQPLGNGGGHAYSLTIPVGSFKGGKSVVVQSNLTDGTSIKSDPASF